MTKLAHALGDLWDCARANVIETDLVLLDGYYGPVCEYALRSTRTGRVVGYWAYGGYAPGYSASTRLGRWISGRLKTKP